MSEWLSREITHRHDWAEGLATFRIGQTLDGFEPGQFVNVALTVGGERVSRSYSVASGRAEPVELFVTRTSAGQFTRHLFELGPGSSIELGSRPAGFFTLRWVPEARDLWLLATGTGLGPFISLMRTGELWQRFARVVLVHGVRQREHLAYEAELLRAVEDHGLHYTSVVTRTAPGSPEAGLVGARIPTLIANGALESHVGLALDPKASHVMICGNPAMIRDSVAVLGERGLSMHRQRKPGQITTEKYW